MGVVSGGACFVDYRYGVFSVSKFERSYTILMRSVSNFMRSVSYFMRSVSYLMRSTYYFMRSVSYLMRSSHYFMRSVSYLMGSVSYFMVANRDIPKRAPRPATRTWSAAIPEPCRSTPEPLGKGSLGSPRSQAPLRMPQGIIILLISLRFERA